MTSQETVAQEEAVAEAAPSPADEAAAGRPAASGRTRVVPAAVAGLCAAIQLAYVRQGGFFLDDFRNLGNAKAGGLSFSLLIKPVGAIRFQPFGRLLYWVAADPLHANYFAAATLLAVITGVGAYWLIRLLDVLFGRRSLHLVIGFLFGTSWIFIATDQWYTAGQAMAAATFTVGACLGFANWLRRGGPRPYVAGLVAASLAVLSWEQSLAIPGWLLLMWLCFARDAKRSVRQVLLALVPFVLVSVAFMAYVQAQPWHQALVVPSIGGWLRLYWAMVFDGLAPTVVGTGLATVPPSAWGWASALVVTVGLSAGAVWLAVRRRFRPQALVFFFVGVALVTIIIAGSRLHDLGPTTAGTTPRYIDLLPFVLALSVAGAIKPRPASHARAARRTRVLPVVLVVGALYLVNLTFTFDNVSFGRQVGQAAAATSQRIGNGLAALGPGRRSSVVDSAVPFPIWYPEDDQIVNDGEGELSYLLPYWSSTVRTIGEGRDLTALDPDGVLRSVTFEPGGPGLRVERVTVKATAPTVMVVTVEGRRPVEPERPWRIAVAPGSHSFTLPAWADQVRGVMVRHGSSLRVLDEQSGTLRYGPAVVRQGRG